MSKSMDLNNCRKHRIIDDIHMEIYKETSDYKNYCLGVAQGVYFVYKVLNDLKDKNYTIEEIMEGIKLGATDECKVNDYFNRLLKEIES